MKTYAKIREENMKETLLYPESASLDGLGLVMEDARVEGECGELLMVESPRSLSVATLSGSML